MEQEVMFETRQHQTVVCASSLHAHLGVVTDLRLWVIMHTAAGNAQPGVDVFHDGTPETACWSLDFAAEVAVLEDAPEIADLLRKAACQGQQIRA